MGKIIWKDGQSKVVDDKRLNRFLDEGWTLDPQPKMSVSVEATADVIEPTPEEEEVQNEIESEEGYAWHDEAEMEDLLPPKANDSEDED